MKRIIAAITALIMAIMLWAIAHAGTYRNISSTSQQYVTIAGTSGMVKPGENATTYQQLDILDPATWLRIDDEPYAALSSSDQDITVAANATETVTIDINTAFVYLWNLGSTDIRVSLNSEDNPYPAIMVKTNAVNDADELHIRNERTISTIYLKNLSETTEGLVKVRVIP